MSDNVIQFGKKEEPTQSSWMIQMNIYEDANGVLEVAVEQSDAFDANEIFVALMSATIQYGTQEGVVEDDINAHDETIH